jgi:hypothetical protein
MSRYLLGGLLIFATLATLFGVGSSEGLMSRIDRGTRNAISANPADASNTSTLEEGGNNVQRQVTQDGVTATGATTPTDTGATTSETGATGATTSEDATTGATDATGATGASQPAQDPIPALW